MRLHIEMTCSGRTLEEIQESLASKWCEFVSDDSAEIPGDSEIYVYQHGEEDPDSEFYTAKLVARTKV